MTSLTSPDNSVATRTYTPRSQLATLSYTPAGGSASSVATFAYNTAGRETTRTLGNGLIATRTYRTDGLLATLNTTGLGDDLAYTYDANKNPTSETRTGVMSPYSWSTPANGFDELDRLVNWSRTNGNTQLWTLTASNNWQSVVTNGVNENRTHTPAHEIAAIGSLNQVHDNRGNLIIAECGIHS